MPLTSILPYPSIDPAFAGSFDGYTPGLAFDVIWTPAFYNQVVTAANGASLSIGLSPYALHQFELNYEVLRDLPGVSLEFRRVLGFYSFMRGSLGRFGFNFPDDNKVLAQFLGIGDGSTTTFTLVRSLGDPTFPAVGDQLAEPIGHVNSAVQPLQFYWNGTPTAGTVNGIPGANTVTFGSAPAPGVTVTGDYGHQYYCRFVEDSLRFEKFSGGRWRAMSVKLISCLAGA